MAEARSRRRALGVALLLAAAAAGAALALARGGDEDPAPVRPLAGRAGEDRLTGEVVENDLGCRRGGACFLRLRGQPPELRIVYHYGEAPACLNTTAALDGERVRVGQRIEVFGRYEGAGTALVLATCASRRYSIRILG